MKKTNTIGIIVLVLLLAVGFAAVATNLIINGQATIGVNQEDFNVYFSKAVAEEGGTAAISGDKKTITYSTKTLRAINDEAVLEYTVTNDSANYDANVEVTWSAVDIISGVDYSTYYTVTRTGFTLGTATVVPGKSSVDGTIVIALVKPVLEDVEITFTMTFTANATERTEEAIASSTYEIVSGDLDTVGSVVKIADEEFYVIGQEDTDHVKLLSKYNLNVGNNIQPGTEGIQNSLAIGWNSDESTAVNNHYPATVIFSNANYWYDGSKLKPAYGTSYPTYVYDDNSNVKQYVDDYVDYLETQGVNVTGRLIKQEELVGLGCDESSSSCSSAPTWVYQTSFWSGSAFSKGIVWCVRSFGVFINDLYDDDTIYGVRPVIILEK